jgi:hypothetical protein
LNNSNNSNNNSNNNNNNNSNNNSSNSNNSIDNSFGVHHGDGTGRMKLYTSLCPVKDQTYFLSRYIHLTQSCTTSCSSIQDNKSSKYLYLYCIVLSISIIMFVSINVFHVSG